jgi:hypothetical protein
MLLLVQFWPLRLPSYWVMVSNLQLFASTLFKFPFSSTLSHEFLAYFLNMLSTRVASWKMICGGHFSVPHPSIFIKNHCLLLQILEKLMSGALINPHQERQQVETLAENPQPLPYHPLLRRRTNLRLHRPPLHHHGISSHLIWLLIYIYIVSNTCHIVIGVNVIH